MPFILVPRDRFGYRHRFHSRFPLQCVVESPQELPARTRIIFPRILAVQKDWHHRILSASHNRFRRFSDLVHEVLSRLLRGHS